MMAKRSHVRTVFCLDFVVRLARGSCCPACGIELHAEDVQPLDHGEVRLLCRGCHRDFLTIECR